MLFSLAVKRLSLRFKNSATLIEESETDSCIIDVQSLHTKKIRSASSIYHNLVRVIGSRRYSAAASRPIGMEELAARFVDALIGVRAKEIALRLQQVRRQPLGAVSVVERKRGREGRSRHAELDRFDNARAATTLGNCSACLLKKSSSSRFVSCGFLSYASLILPRKRLRMMQPPRHISAMPPIFRFHPSSLAASRSSM